MVLTKSKKRKPANPFWVRVGVRVGVGRVLESRWVTPLVADPFLMQLLHQFWQIYCPF